MTRFVCEEVAAVGMAALDELEHNPPRGVAEYFEQQFDQLRINLQLPFTRDSLGILLVARGGITPLELADALGAAAWDVEDALRPLRRLLIGHERLSLLGAEHFRGALERRLGERETNRYRALLLAWCERYEAAGWPLETPAYALSNYAVLLREAGAREKLYRLPGAPWRRRRLAQTGSYAGYVDDLWLAREAAAEPPADLVEVVRALMRVG